MREHESVRTEKTHTVALRTILVSVFGTAAIVALATFSAPQSSSKTTSGSVMEAITPNAGPQRDLAAADASSGEAREFVGYRHKGVVRGKKLPNGLRDLGGGLLSDENYGVSRFSKYKRGKMMLWLEKIVERDNKGVPLWEVKDALGFDKLKQNQTFLFSYSSPCTDDAEENLDLIVLAETHRKQKTVKVLKAWRADLELERFESIAIEGIVCRL